LERVEQTVTRLVGQLVRREREAAGMSLDVLAERMRPLWPKVSKGYLSNIESGRRRPSLAKLYLVAMTLGVEISRLLPDNPSAMKESSDR
jgi:transcriptional regulator with XRE-family HTH domain